MKLTSLAFLVLSLLCAHLAAPTFEEFQEVIRVKRVTCDLLSFKGFKLNHSACAAHCLALGKRGGYCNNKKVCVCRR
uniref:Defensin n=1 Tax=Sphaeridium scarabaeoides TaxID=295564 RepID=A0A9E8MA03_9COLE|nr:defensin [Sphaeridium marginatum]